MKVVELKPLLEYSTVRTWLEGLKEHWGGDPATDDPERLPILEAFCRFADVDPDTIIRECTRIDKAGDRRISVKGRRKWAELIDRFQEQVEGSRVRQAKWGNTVRSFLIHNGILLAAGAQMARKD
ncbi:MAG TPA: hypothetical protein VNM43_07845 [Dehalococcoidia bacterium]|nr:hypothetical protein [Dehalococcoidia bacterium]